MSSWAETRSARSEACLVVEACPERSRRGSLPASRRLATTEFSSADPKPEAATSTSHTPPAHPSKRADQHPHPSTLRRNPDKPCAPCPYLLVERKPAPD